MLPYPDLSARARARILRRAPTDAETILWSRLRRKQMHGLRFRRQEPLGSFIVDFACLNARIVVELDGEQHGEAISYDEKRTEYLGRLGFRVLRFSNRDVFFELENVLDTIWLAIDQRGPTTGTR